MILSPHGRKQYRLIVIGRKRLPEIGVQHERNWGFVQKVGRRPEDVENELEAFPEFSMDLAARFRQRRFAPADPPDFLDREGTENILIGADEDVRGELGISLDPEHETMDTAEIFRDLHMERSKHPLQPLFQGKWV